MNTEIPRAFRRVWDALTEVPGWPDAPRLARLRRMVPLVLPCVAALGLTGWAMLVREPAKRADRAMYQPLTQLEADVASLQLGYSEQQAEELKANAEKVSSLLLNSGAETAKFLAVLREKIQKLGWDATFQTYDTASEAPAPDALVAFAPARARLTPSAETTEPFPALLATLEQFFSAEKRIDLTRLAVRADEPGRTTVEINLRVAYRVTHEKAAE